MWSRFLNIYSTVILSSEFFLQERLIAPFGLFMCLLKTRISILLCFSEYCGLNIHVRQRLEENWRKTFPKRMKVEFGIHCICCMYLIYVSKSVQ